MKRIRRVAARALAGAVAVLLVLAAVLVVNTLRHGKTARADAAPPADEPVDAAQVAEHLAQALRFATVSHEDPAEDDGAQLDALRAMLEATYPKTHAALARERVGEHALVYRWQGSDPSLRPALLAAHQDVVPVEASARAAWAHAPFEGTIADGYVWGRGALDDKGALVATFEAVEALLARGFTPKRTVVLAFGCDEEVGGARGAKRIAEAFAAKGERFEYVLDEGGFVTRGLLPDVAAPVALVGVTEKGFVTVELTVDVAGGHSSMPPPQTAVGILSAAIARLEREQMPPRLTWMSRRMLETIAPELPLPKRVMMSNLWLFEPLVLSAMTKQPTTNAGVRTTTAATLFQAGVKENVLPSSARALVNFRILPGDSIADVLEHVNRAVGDPRVVVTRRERMLSEAPPASPVDSRAFRLVEGSIRRAFPQAIVAPNVLVGASDARHYTPLADGVYHFVPFVVTRADIATIHGTGERVPVDGLTAAVRFYEAILRDGE